MRVVLAFVVLPGRGFTGDLQLFAQWALTLADHGPGRIYEADATANYPPAYLIVLWVVGVAARLGSSATGTPDVSVALVLVKVPAVVADIACAWLLAYAGRRYWSPRVGLGAAALYLLAPVPWYDSAVWGQVDSVAALPVLGSLVLLAERRPAAAVACAAVAILVKPQAAVVLAVLLPVLARRHLVERRDPAALARASGAAAGVIALCLPFDLEHFAAPQAATLPVIGDLSGLWGLYRSVGATFSVLTANAYNLWAFAGPRPLAATISAGQNRWTPDDVLVTVPLLGDRPASAVGAVLLLTAAAAVGLPLLLVRGLEASPRALMLAHVVLAVAFFALPTRAHERYLFPAYVTGALVAASGAVAAVGYLTASLATTANLHAVLAGPLNGGLDGSAAPARPGPGAPPAGAPSDAGPGGQSIWSALGDWSRSEAVVSVVSVVHTVLMVVVLVCWCAVVTLHRSRSGRLTGTAERPDEVTA